MVAVDADRAAMCLAEPGPNRAPGAREVAGLTADVDRPGGFEGLVGEHPSMVRLYRAIALLAPTPATVLITGESGTGKELVARALHARGTRSAGPFVGVNLAALPEGLVESELFGHERGAFTGAHARRAGWFELAARGTLFLDEVGCLRPDAQAKLLRALQERAAPPVGGRAPVPHDVRVVAATNADLAGAVRAGAFRADLYYRLNVVPLAVPALRERREDIPLLARHFVARLARACARPEPRLAAAALERLAAHDWPGNVRELENVLQRAVALAPGPVLGPDDLALDPWRLPLAAVSGVAAREGAEPTAREVAEPTAEWAPLRPACEAFERAYVLRALNAAGWNVSRAARLLGVHRNTVLAKLAAWRVERPTQPVERPLPPAGPPPQSAAVSR